MLFVVLALIFCALISFIVAAIIIRAVRYQLRQRRIARNYRRDLSAITMDRECASCGGTATELTWDLATGVHLCKDRELCRQTLIYRSMLDSMS